MTRRIKTKMKPGHQRKRCDAGSRLKALCCGRVTVLLNCEHLLQTSKAIRDAYVDILAGPPSTTETQPSPRSLSRLRQEQMEARLEALSGTLLELQQTTGASACNVPSATKAGSHARMSLTEYPERAQSTPWQYDPASNLLETCGCWPPPSRTRTVRQSRGLVSDAAYVLPRVT